MQQSSNGKRTVVVTGGAGFIGSHVVERLLSTKRFEVVVVDDFNDFYDPALKRANAARYLTHGDTALVEADLLDAPAIEGVFAEHDPDVVIHLAARAGVRPSLVDPMLYQRVNVEGTYRLLELSKQHGVEQFLFASSSSVYGARSTVPFRETDRIDRPASPYAATKIAGECACSTYSDLYGMRILCLRFFTVFGPRQRPDLAIRKFTERLLEGRSIPLFGDGSSARDYTFIDDIVDGVMRAVDYDASQFEVINLGGESPTRLIELVEVIAETLGVEPEIEWLPNQPGDVPVTYADVTKARELLGYAPATDIRQGIARFVEWYRAEGRSSSTLQASAPRA